MCLRQEVLSVYLCAWMIPYSLLLSETLFVRIKKPQSTFVPECIQASCSASVFLSISVIPGIQANDPH